jgi:hypothetical protein
VGEAREDGRSPLGGDLHGAGRGASAGALRAGARRAGLSRARPLPLSRPAREPLPPSRSGGRSPRRATAISSRPLRPCLPASTGASPMWAAGIS